MCVCVLIGKSKREAGACEPRVNGDAPSGNIRDSLFTVSQQLLLCVFVYFSLTI